jgi:hypothetical protein
MVFDAADAFTFSAGTGFSNLSTDKTQVTAANPTAGTATTLYSDAFDFKKGGTGVAESAFVVVRYFDTRNTTNSNSCAVQFNVQVSADGTTWADRTSGALDAVTAITNAVQWRSGVVNLPLLTELRYARLAIVLTPGASATVSTTITADLNISQL